MRTTQIRQQLHDYIDSAEDKKLKAIYTLLEEDITEGFVLSDEQKHELDRRYNNYQNGIGRSYNREEIDAIIEHALAGRQNKG
jgi:hypothetical protein